MLRRTFLQLLGVSGLSAVGKSLFGQVVTADNLSTDIPPLKSVDVFPLGDYQDIAVSAPLVPHPSSKVFAYYIDRSQWTDPNTVIRVDINFSMDGGLNYKPFCGFNARGGLPPQSVDGSPVANISGVTTDTGPPGAVFKATMTVLSGKLTAPTKMDFF